MTSAYPPAFTSVHFAELGPWSRQQCHIQVARQQPARRRVALLQRRPFLTRERRAAVFVVRALGRSGVRAKLQPREAIA